MRRQKSILLVDDKSRGGRIYRLFDVVAKLVTAGAFIYAAYTAGQFESKISGTTILSQREQAESQLRASMFHDLIDPIVGPLKDGEEISPDRQRLLVELLALNFHEHIEFKPLLEDIYERLSLDQEAESQRENLRSVARRVIDRQITLLCVEAEKCELDGYGPVQLFFENKNATETDLEVYHWIGEPGELVQNGPNKLVQNGPVTPASLGQNVCVKSPDNEYLLRISLQEVDTKHHRCNVGIVIKHEATQTTLPPLQFWLTLFDFPFTDNTRIDKDHRFSLVLYNISGYDSPPSEELTVGCGLVWFPPDFITSRERPLNYREIRKLLNINDRKGWWWD